MRHQRVGEIGCYLKLSLLRALSDGYRLGIAWYLVPDSGRPSAGLQTGYLDLPDRWRQLDPEVFDALHSLVRSGRRSVPALQRSGVINAIHSSRPLEYERVQWTQRVRYRAAWFEGVLADLRDCNLIFADPEMGLIENGKPMRADHALRITLEESKALAKGRTAIIYHPNSMRAGGHDEEVQHWLDQFDANAFAMRADAYSARTFFIINPTPAIKRRAMRFCARWQDLSVNLQGAPPVLLTA